MTENGWLWKWSCRINRCLGGRRGEPLCSRAWREGWSLFDGVMQIAWRDPVHCEARHLRWLAGLNPRGDP